MQITIPSGEERRVNSKKYSEYFLIVCEDQKTEPDYFAQFQTRFDSLFPEKRTVYLESVGTGLNSLGVVERAIEERDRLQNEASTHIDHVWVVFDKDSLDQTAGNRNRFDAAFKIANKERINVAYSNECFELWLLLHFNEIPANKPLNRYDDIYPMFENALNEARERHGKGTISYDHKHPNPDVLEAVRLYGSQEGAIRRARSLDDYHTENAHIPIESNPNTLVYRLVEELNNLYAWYSYP